MGGQGSAADRITRQLHKDVLKPFAHNVERVGKKVDENIFGNYFRDQNNANARACQEAAEKVKNQPPAPKPEPRQLPFPCSKCGQSFGMCDGGVPMKSCTYFEGNALTSIRCSHCGGEFYRVAHMHT